MHLPRKERLCETIEFNISAGELGPFFSFYSLNVSISGALLASFNSPQFSVGQKVHLCIDPFENFLPRYLVLMAKIIRTVQPIDEEIVAIYGVAFCNYSPDDILILEKYINSKLTEVT